MGLEPVSLCMKEGVVIDTIEGAMLRVSWTGIVKAKSDIRILEEIKLNLYWLEPEDNSNDGSIGIERSTVIRDGRIFQ